LTVVVYKDITANLEFESVFAEGPHSVEKHQHHSEEAAQIGKGYVESHVTTIKLLNQVGFLEVNSDQFVCFDDFKVADNRTLIEGDSPLCHHVAHGLRVYTEIGIYLVLGEEYVRPDCNSV
jgi:hypothetical protein